MSVRALFAKAQGSAIRELGLLAQEPDMVSLAGGMPDPALLPLAPVREAYARALASDNPSVLQYGPTDGLPACKEAIAGFLATHLGPHGPEDWVITTGSQQGIDLAARTLLDAGDTVAVEAHAYPAALQAFRFCEARIAGVAADEQGMLPQALADLAGRQRVKAIYLVPTYGNPTGALMGTQRRIELLKAAASAGAVLIEDDPYRCLGFDEAAAPPTLHQLNEEHRLGAQVVYLTSFSKTIAPALRVGALLAPPALRRAVVLAKQAADIHSGLVDQGVLVQLLRGDWLAGHLAALRRHYATKGQALHAALQTHAADLMSWQPPRGGMFIWGTLRGKAPAGTDWKALFREHRVLFVPGREFSADGSDAGHLRLSFAHPSVERLHTGAQRLARVLRQALRTA
ncbi:aminotransferase-like domain-containing protein [Ideonella sp. BN130291]|uniref:aminotransferase-like domain-containing protein n=1 Tax=Ideonella sp. BN130291 TaxID=3112940 RepID=UPI002E26046F|nr:PLP-dependent aminotransferase family protein [Ideonella sp. BN130291]